MSYKNELENTIKKLQKMLNLSTDNINTTSLFNILRYYYFNNIKENLEITRQLLLANAGSIIALLLAVYLFRAMKWSLRIVCLVCVLLYVYGILM